MLNKRLSAVASLVSKDSFPLDVGTDHGLLPIYLIQNKKCQKALASDISPNALKNAENNIKKYNVSNIELYVSDGLEKIPKIYDTIIISGMGTSSILDILNKDDLPDTIILSSNNDLELLRTSMNKKGYKIAKEIVVYEKNKYYDIILYKKGKERLTKFQKEFGKSNDLDYYNHLYKINKKIYEVASLNKKTHIKKSLKRLAKVIGKKMDY